MLNRIQLLALNEKDALENNRPPVLKPAIFEEVPSPLEFVKSKNGINDFKRQPLMTNPQSFVGPCMVKGDVNKDGLEDVYVGGNKNEPGALYIQQKNGKFIKNQNHLKVIRRVKMLMQYSLMLMAMVLLIYML
ncbi:FG-GAP repeat domain-containing protein [Pedobacter steynii]